jgi:hypothetical protein
MMDKRYFSTMLVCVLFACKSIYAQSINTYNDIVHRVKHTPEVLESWRSGGYFSSGKSIYNVKGSLLVNLKGRVFDFKVCPNGKSYSALYMGKRGAEIFIGDLWKKNKSLKTIINDYEPTALCYNGNNELIISGSNGCLYFYDTDNYNLLANLRLSNISLPNIIDASSDSRKVAVASDYNIEIYDIEKGSLYASLKLNDNIVAMQFSGDNKSLNIITSDGIICEYSLSSFSFLREIGPLGEIVDGAFHPNDKYAAVLTRDNMITLINLFNPVDRFFCDDMKDIPVSVSLFQEDQNLTYLMYGTEHSVVYKPMSSILPNYTRLIDEELDNLMNMWLQRMDGETMEQYNLRVNEETIEKQRRLYEEELATNLAGDLVTFSDVALRDFNMETNTLALNIGPMPTIYLDVPAEDVGFFKDQKNLEFSNAIYGVNAEDKFELLYLDVVNTQTGETYTFDNRERRSLEYMHSQEAFVPIDLVIMSNMDDVKLETIKDEILTQARSQNLISNNTEIDVTSKAVSRINEQGRKVIDYNIGFKYDVKAKYSAKEDYAPGEYHIDRSGAAKSLASIIKTAFEGEFAKYVQSGKKLEITITGMADILTIKRGIYYDGVYGNFINQPVGNNGETITLKKSTNITTNKQLAFIRAAGLKNYLEKNLHNINSMDVDYKYNIELAERAGGEYRRISVEFRFLDVF